MFLESLLKFFKFIKAFSVKESVVFMVVVCTF